MHNPAAIISNTGIMNIVFRKVLNETLRFHFTCHGIYESSSEFQTDWLMAQSDVLAFLACGRGEITLRETGVTYHAAPGEAIISNGGTIRRNRFFPENGILVIYWIHLHYEIMNGFNLLKLFRIPKVFRNGAARKIGEAIKELIEVDTSGGADISMCGVAKEKALGMELLYLMSGECKLRDDALPLLDGYRKQADIIDYIERHLKDKITIADLARKSCLSESRFHRVFKKAAGKSPMEFIIEMRVRKAQTLLATTDMSLPEIAAASGFSNVNYFSRIFKQYSGSAPAAYRSLLENQLLP